MTDLGKESSDYMDDKGTFGHIKSGKAKVKEGTEKYISTWFFVMEYILLGIVFVCLIITAISMIRGDLPALALFRKNATTIALLCLLFVLIEAVALIFGTRYREAVYSGLHKEERDKLDRDPLTNLYNRRYAKELIEKSLTENIGHHYFMMLDLDGLKKINDSFGHEAGDFALKTFARALIGSFGEGDIHARVGGDEFVSFITSVKSDRELKQLLKQFLKELDRIGTGESLKLSCSIGVTIASENNRDYDVLYKQADAAMYSTKNSGKNDFKFYKDYMERDILSRKRNAVEEYDPYKYSDDCEKYGYDYKDVFIWLLDNMVLDNPTQLRLKNKKDFAVVLNPMTYDVIDVISTEEGKAEGLFEEWGNRKCYEAILSGNDVCEECNANMCNHNSFLIHTKHVDSLNADFLVRSIYAKYSKETCLVHVYQELIPGEECTVQYNKALEAQNLINSCTYCDFDPYRETNDYFKYQIQTICHYFGAAEGYILRMDGDMTTSTYNIPTEKTPNFKLDMSRYAKERWKSWLDQNILVFLSDVETLKDTNAGVYDFFKKHDVKNCVVSPVWDGQRIYGYICMRNITRNEDELSNLCSITRLIKDVMSTLNDKEETLERRYYDETTESLNYEGLKKKVRSVDIYNSSLRYAFCMWDVRKFKYINDSFGFRTGNGLLRDMADIALRCLGSQGVLCRVSGDQFCALCCYQEKKELEDKFKTISESVDTAFNNGKNQRFNIELSVGIYEVTNSERLEIDDMINMAAIAEKKAKEGLGTHILFYDETLRALTKKEREMETRMEEALRKREFVIYLQPQIYIGAGGCDKDVMRAEALCRWIRDGEIYATPAEFIPVFEKSGSITTLDIYMIEASCVLLKQLKEKTQIKTRIAVNVSRITLLKGNFLTEFDSILSKYGIENDELEIEFTEGVAVTDFDKFYEVLGELKKRGCICAMDDFGSEYSNLNILQKLPIDILKLDKKFFEAESRHEADKARHDTIVENTIKMAKKLNMQTIAEGIESSEQVEELKKAECDFIQGFVYAKPMAVSDYINWVENRLHG